VIGGHCRSVSPSCGSILTTSGYPEAPKSASSMPQKGPALGADHHPMVLDRHRQGSGDGVDQLMPAMVMQREAVARGEALHAHIHR
jgi:hypothetical protein